MLQIYWPPQTGSTTHLGWTRGQGCQCLLRHWSAQSRAGCSQAAAPAAGSGDTSGSHTQAEGARVGSACGILAWRGTQARGAPAHTEPVFATLNLGWDMESTGQAASCTKASVPDASLAPPCSMAWTSLKHPLGWIIPNFPSLSHLVATWAWRIPVPCLS